MPSRPFLAALGLVLLAACAPQKPAETPKSTVQPAKPPEVYRVKLETTKGDILVEVRREWSPHGADHFHYLTGLGFYNGVKFHRVLKKFIAQFGINGDPKTHQLYSTLRIPDDPPKLKNKRGTLAFAKIGPASRTTEVFINLADNALLDRTGFVPFGRVVEGMETADNLAYLYGELQPKGGGPDAARIQQLGNDYLDRLFPRLDSIKKATLVSAP